MGKESSTLLGILAGTAIGATLGILFAPDKGSKTRQRIADEALAAKDKVADTVSSNKATLDEQIESIVSNVSHKTEDVITTLEKKLSELKAKNKKYQKS